MNGAPPSGSYLGPHPTHGWNVQQGRHQKSSLFLVHRIDLLTSHFNTNNERTTEGLD